MLPAKQGAFIKPVDGVTVADLASSLSIYSKALSLRAQRHQVLASNIANADTPNYKARDFDFRMAMQQAAGASGAALAQTSPRHLDGGQAMAGANLQYRRETQSAVDGNTVDMDVERAQIADNALQYEVLTRLISQRLQGMQAALSSTNA